MRRHPKPAKRKVQGKQSTSEILRVISSSPTTLDPMLEAVVKTAARLCEANNASLYRVEGDLMRKVAGHGSIGTTQQVGDTRPVTRGSVIGRAMVERRTLHIADLLGEVDTLHGGRIWVESALGRGSTFTFTLPVG